MKELYESTFIVAELLAKGQLVNEVNKLLGKADGILAFNIAVLEQAGLPAIRFRDLRHTAASLMLNHNVPVLVVAGCSATPILRSR